MLNSAAECADRARIVKTLMATLMINNLIFPEFLVFLFTATVTGMSNCVKFTKFEHGTNNKVLTI
jgi:hypothetical protein